MAIRLDQALVLPKGQAGTATGKGRAVLKTWLTCTLVVACMCAPLAHAQLAYDPVEAQASSQEVRCNGRSDADLSAGDNCKPSPNSPEANLPEAALNSSPDVERVASSANDRAETAPKRILGIVPNYRTTQGLKDYRPITAREKFAIAGQDSFDRGTFILGALLGGEAQLTKSTPSFGQGASASAQYFASSFTDFVVANYMTEAIYPTIFHQDPRYFRRETGSGWSRLGSAVSQIFRTRVDSGRMQFNFSEIIGASTSAAISNAYYPDNRNASDTATRFGVQVAADMVGNILKEFSPELSGLFSRKHGEKKASK
jgi:hypothetical protein